MQISFKTLALSAVAFCATAAFAANQARVEVPFGFTAHGQSYPAGIYEVSVDANHNFITLASKSDATKHITWGAGPADAAMSPAVMKFDQIGADYTLKTIQMGERVTPNLETRSKRGISATTSIGGQ